MASSGGTFQNPAAALRGMTCWVGLGRQGSQAANPEPQFMSQKLSFLTLLPECVPEPFFL